MTNDTQKRLELEPRDTHAVDAIGRAAARRGALIFVEEIDGETIDDAEVLKYGRAGLDVPRDNWMTEEKGFDVLSSVAAHERLEDLGLGEELWVLHDDGGRDGARWFPVHVLGYAPN